MARSEASIKQALHCARMTIGTQVPSLAYMGIAFWAAWNSIAFSGSIWLQTPDPGIIAEELVLMHLAACAITLLLLAGFSRKCARLIRRPWFVFLGAAAAVAGTALILLAYFEPLKSPFVVFGACLLTGSGTTVQFVRAAPMFGALPPRRSIVMLAAAMSLSVGVYFVLTGLPAALGRVGFALLPLLSALFYLFQVAETPDQRKILDAEAPLSRHMALFSISLVLCSMAYELARSLILVNESATTNSAAAVLAQFFVLLVLLIAILFVLCNERHQNYARYYSIIIFALVAVLVIMAATPFQNVYCATAASTICNCYNVLVWAMLAYIVFQAESNAIKIFCIGNAMLSIGTMLGGAIPVLNTLHPFISDSTLTLVLVLLGLIVLVDLLFVFSEDQLAHLLKPIEEARLADDRIDRTQDRPKRWVIACEEIARNNGLSPRETDVFITLARGKSAQEIADKETLSIYTVRAHIRSIYAKLDVHSKKELADFVEKHV